jgi:CheY-like chemotaxis protein
MSSVVAPENEQSDHVVYEVMQAIDGYTLSIAKTVAISRLRNAIFMRSADAKQTFLVSQTSVNQLVDGWRTFRQAALSKSAAGRGPGVATKVRRTRPEMALAETFDIRHHVLLVDDVADVLVTVGAFLVREGFTVQKAANGNEALRIIASDPRIDLLVTDFVMPDLSGAELIAHAVRIQPNLKAMVITGYPNADGLAELPLHTTILVKPFRQLTLIARIMSMLDEMLDEMRTASDEMAARNAADERESVAPIGLGLRKTGVGKTYPVPAPRFASLDSPGHVFAATLTKEGWQDVRLLERRRESAR